MKVKFSNTLKKFYKKSPDKIQKEFHKRLGLFLGNPHYPLLNNHPLKGKLLGLRSINITGDWRALYSEEKTTKNIIFELIGTHGQLYK